MGIGPFLHEDTNYNIPFVDLYVSMKNCGFDESKQYDVYPEGKKSQKAKGNYTPYKMGGFGRTK